MAWTAPMTAVANTAFTAAQFNTHIRDNLLQTAPAKATSSFSDGSHFVKDGTNNISTRTTVIGSVIAQESTSNTSYGDLGTFGPSVTCTTGARAMVWVSAYSFNNSSNSCFMSVDVSGSTTFVADDVKALRHQGTDSFAASHAFLYTTLNAGSNTFTAKYRVASGTGTWQYRQLIVMPF